MYLGNMTNTMKGRIGQTNVAGKLRHQGFEKVLEVGYYEPYDLWVDGMRVEVKRSLPQKNWRWLVNIHRHGKTKEAQVDFYVFCLDGIPGNDKMPIYLVFRAPLSVPTMSFSFSSLLRQHHNAIDNWDLMRGKKKSGATAR
jgi:hypothetical protein